MTARGQRIIENPAQAIALARETVSKAWIELPGTDRRLLEQIRANEWSVSDRPLGDHADALLRSAGSPGVGAKERERLNRAAGLWLPELGLVLIYGAHPDVIGLEESAYENAIARIAWHEWGHALGLERATEEDVRAGRHLLSLLPAELADAVRSAGYLHREYTHEVVAEVFAILMIRRRLGQTGRPEWLAEEIYELIRRVVGWTA